MTGHIHPDRMSRQEIRKIQEACCHVFIHGKALQSRAVCEHNRYRVSYPFLEGITFEDVKRAFRANVLAHHPDRHQDKSDEEIRAHARFMEGVNRSYDHLNVVFGMKVTPAAYDPAPEGRIIAVGGAKGGIGKSVFAANLGMSLSALGYRVLLVDLDLGGSDLHIYLGHRSIPALTINDYLNRKAASLDEVVLRRPAGPMLIPGNNSELGIANIAFQRKVRLIEAIRKIEADYVILDLGGGTDFNTLDFFLAADVGIVLTTLDQPAYLEAYALIKTALQRKLTRLFGADSTFSHRRSEPLRKIVLDGTQASDEHHQRTVSELLDTAARDHPLAFPALAREILGFSPLLVINRSFNANEAAKVAGTLRSVARERLCVDLGYSGCISKHPVVEQSTSYAHHPIVARQPMGGYASELRTVIDSLDLLPPQECPRRTA